MSLFDQAAALLKNGIIAECLRNRIMKQQDQKQRRAREQGETPQTAAKHPER